MKVIATAGHVDHGKSALVEALTGTHPDRLKEEQEREMTIDLGFAWIDLPSRERVGIIDVPGHRDFIDNMLAGVGGVDAVLLVVAADEGIMPQTREHLDILDLLEVERGIVAVTKVDLVPDEEWLEFVREDIRELLKSTRLRDAPLVAVSAHTGKGLDALRSNLEDVLSGTPDALDVGKPRLPVDRVFSLPGFGTIVTGTLADGSFSIGDDVLLLPGTRKGRIRGLQSYHEAVQLAVPGSRVAINISGVDVNDIQRGQVVVKPGQYQSTRRLDIKFRLLPNAVQELKHNQKVKLFHTAAQRQARVRILGQELIESGGSGWVQIELEEPIVAARGDQIILRRPSPGATLGGGVVHDPHPDRRHRRRDASTLKRLEQIASGTPGDMLEAALNTTGPVSLEELSKTVNLEDKVLRDGIQELLDSQRIKKLVLRTPATDGDIFLLSASSWQALQTAIIKITGEYHVRHPLRRGIPLEELRSKLKIDAKLKNQMLDLAAQDNAIRILGDQVAQFHFKPDLSNDEKEDVDEIMELLGREPYSTPTMKILNEKYSGELLAYLVANEKLIRLGEDVVFRKDVYQEMVKQVRDKLSGGNTMSIADIRDMFSTSRKYALALMEHLDRIKVTVREGDVRRLA